MGSMIYYQVASTRLPCDNTCIVRCKATFTHLKHRTEWQHLLKVRLGETSVQGYLDTYLHELVSLLLKPINYVEKWRMSVSQRRTFVKSDREDNMRMTGRKKVVCSLK